MAMNLLYLSCRPRRLPAIVLSTSLGIDPSPLALNISSSGTVIHPIVSVILRKLSPSHVVALRIIFADLLDNFQIDDPNGTHEVLVSELTGYLLQNGKRQPDPCLLHIEHTCVFTWFQNLLVRQLLFRGISISRCVDHHVSLV